jgi:hypothetical protein
MSDINDGGPAFPWLAVPASNNHGGMTLRDYFAAKAMQGMSARVTTTGAEVEIVKQAYRVADAMLAARGPAK